MTDLPLIYTGDDAPNFDEAEHKYTHPETGAELDGATTVLGVLDKPALPWWGMKVGVQGLLTLVEKEGIEVVDLDADEIVQLLTKHKLTVNHLKDKGAEKGRTAHDLLEDWARHGTPISMKGVNDYARPRVRAAARFLVDVQPKVVEGGVEVMVWDYHRMLAGTFDLLAWIDGELWLLDYKTSKDIYTSHALQLAGYEGMRIDLGLRPVDRMGVVLLKDDGTYVLEEQHAKPVEFFCVYRAYAAVRSAKERQTAARRRKKSSTTRKG